MKCVDPARYVCSGTHMEWSGFLNYTKALPQYQRDLSPSNKFSYYFTNAYGGRVYISAFNEEGFQVTAAGLLDLATGESISPEGLGSDEADSDVTIFNGDVQVAGLLTASGGIESNQQSLVKIRVDAEEGPNEDQPSEGRGMCWIAPGRAIAGVSEADGAAFDTQNEKGLIQGITTLGPDGYSGPHFTTPAWIELWKATNGLLGRATETIKIYVNPNIVGPDEWVGDIPNPTLDPPESYNWDATITDLLSRPPTNPQKRC